MTSHLLQLADRLSPNPCHRSFPAGVGRSNDPFYLVVLDLGEDQLLLDAQGIVAAAVKGVGADAADPAGRGSRP